MSWEPFILPTVVTGAVSAGVALTAIIAGAFVYDAREVARLRALKHHPQARVNRQRPLLTVVISARDNDATIEACLRSVFESNYRNIEVLVVDHGSSDWTRPLVRGCITAHPKRHIRLVARRASPGKSGALSDAVKHYGHGQLVVSLPADGILDKRALVNAARRFAMEPDLDIIKCSRQVTANYSIAGLFDTYRNLSARRVEKFLSVTGLAATPGDAACFRTGAFLRQRSNVTGPSLRVGYAHNVSIAIPAAASLSRLLGRSWHPWPRLQAIKGSARDTFRTRLATIPILALGIHLSVLPVLTTYFLYLALWLHEPTLLLVLLGSFCTWLLFAVQEAEHLRPLTKAAYAFGIPITFGLFYAEACNRLLAHTFLPPARAVIGYTRSRRRGA